MKKKLFILSWSLLLTSLFFSCKKEEINHELNQLTEIVTQSAAMNAATTNVLNWLGDQKALAMPRLKEHLELLTASLELSKTKTEEFNNTIDFIIIPLNKEYNRSKGIDEKNQVNLVVFAGKSGEIMRARMIEFIPEPGNGYIETPVSVIRKVFYRKFPDVNGTFKLSKLSGHLYAEATYKNDKLFSAGIVRKGEEEQVSRRDPVIECTNWYLYETWYDENGNLINWSITYLYTICEELDGGGGGGDGDGESEWHPEECNMTTSEAQAAIASITSIISSDGLSNIGQETGPDAGGIIRKPVLVTRHRIKYSFPGGKTATYALFFPGIIFKTTTSSSWKWESIKFDKIDRIDGSNPACLSTSVSAVVSLIISTDKTKADFTADVKAELQVSCLGGWVINTKPDTIDGTYYAYEFQ